MDPVVISEVSVSVLKKACLPKSGMAKTGVVHKCASKPSIEAYSYSAKV